MVFEYRLEYGPRRAAIRPAPATAGYVTAAFLERFP